MGTFAWAQSPAPAPKPAPAPAKPAAKPPAKPEPPKGPTPRDQCNFRCAAEMVPCVTQCQKDHHETDPSKSRDLNQCITRCSEGSDPCFDRCERLPGGKPEPEEPE